MSENLNQIALVREPVAAPEPELSIRNLSLQYGDQYAFSDVSFDLYRHRITAIIGPSGCGKSSLLNTLCGLAQQDSSVTIGGQYHHMNTEHRYQTGMIFQQPAPFPFSVYRNFEIPLREAGVRHKKEIHDIMQSCLRDVGLWDEVRKYLHTPADRLSGGQQQRLCIARAIALKPSILLLDEPCSALDPRATEKIEHLLLKLKKQHTILIVTHNLAQARRIADYTGVFWQHRNSQGDHEGTLVEFGHSQQIFLQPVHPATRAYLSGHAG